ncbi:MAG: hypothetical protein J4F48_04520 [Nitrospinae bacterium]|nr:hypothetical protein [Nitrospinota bacterium]
MWDRLRSDHCLGPNGILAEIDAEGTDEPIIAIASTVPASFVQSLPARAHALGKRVTFFDIPVTGAEKTADEVTLLMHGGGEKAVFDRCRPAMDAVAREFLHVGDLAAGQVTKLAIDQILWIYVSAHFILAVSVQNRRSRSLLVSQYPGSRLCKAVPPYSVGTDLISRVIPSSCMATVRFLPLRAESTSSLVGA